MTEAKAGDTVKVHYQGRLQDGRVFDSSAERDPLQFTIGSGEIIPGFEQAVIGMTPGDNKTVTIEAEHAYGHHRDEMVQVVERSQIPEDVEVKPGTRLAATREGGSPLVLTVRDVTDRTVTLDANHPLAGEDLTFEIELVSIE